MSKKALVVSSVASIIGQFNMENINILLSLGFEVEVACNFNVQSNYTDKQINVLKQKLNNIGVVCRQVDFSRNPFNIFSHLKSYRQLKELAGRGNYKLMHCHSPIASVVARLAFNKSRRFGTKVFYTAHGFHFYKGAPKLNWLLYYPLEKLCAKKTDLIFTINSEDLSSAKNRLKAECEYIPGVGIDLERFKKTNVDRSEKLAQFGVNKEDTVLITVAELNANKNHRVAINALAQIKNKNIHYLIVGKGSLEDELKEQVKSLKLEEKVHFLGYRDDIPELLEVSDIFLFPSIREGLGLAAVEAMALGLPVICSDNRGTREFLEEGKNGYSCKFYDEACFAKRIEELCSDKETRLEMGRYAEESAVKFSKTKVNEKMLDIYSKI